MAPLRAAHLADLPNEGPEPGPGPHDAKPGVVSLLRDAVSKRASDLHLEPTARGYDVRLRVDGMLDTLEQIDHTQGRARVNRLMVLAKLLTYRLDIPQEGRCRVVLSDEDALEAAPSEKTEMPAALDLRVSVMPTNHGLRAVVRLPAELIQPRNLNDLGMPPAVLRGLRSFASADAGMLLLCGPAGSGKTTTTYALLEHLVQTHAGVSVVALEDPIERDLPGVTQVQVTPFGELTYERALRSMLRQDPQVLALGEIRDAATAAVAVQAALSGHRLVSTLHAGGPAGAVARLLEMGLERYQVAGALVGVVMLRLVRRCDGTGGYAGRMPVASYAHMDQAARDAVLRGGGTDALDEAFRAQSTYADLRDVAQDLIRAGAMDKPEWVRVFGEEAEPNQRNDPGEDLA